MEFEVPSILNDLVGLACCEARVGFADSLVLGFGEKVFDNPRRVKEFHGEWQLRTESCTWRIIQNQDMYCGYYGDNEENDNLLNSLLNLRILDVVQISLFDIMFVLEKDYRIFLLAQSRDNSHFGIFAPNDVYIEFSSAKEWIISKSNIPSGLTEEERLLSDHSELCFERWEKIIPRFKGETHCRECIYYRPLRGEFYFWDYGICSNRKSEFDGELVGVKSGCINYSNTFEISKL
jgi:hypothetical protein